MQIQKPKGTYDLTPRKAFQRSFLENKVKEVFDRFNYREIRTPTFEQTRLFKRSIGEETDIVSKEMYSFNDDEYTLKPEMTAPVIRAYLENSLYNESPLQKLFYISNMFRKERPQAGRFREFSQFGAEAIGSADYTADAEMIALADCILRELGLKNYEIKVNTIGTSNERAVFLEAFREYLRPRFEELSADSKKRFEKNPLRILDSKAPNDIEILNDAPLLYDYLGDDTKKHFEKVLDLLSVLDVNTVTENRLVRGFDYYTSTTFEFVSDSLGSQNSLLGGGRYDLLTEQLGGKNTPAIGFAAGFERIEMALEAEVVELPGANEITLYVCRAGESTGTEVFKLVHSVRLEGFKCEFDLLKRSLKSQMKEADRLNAKYVLVLGDDEVKNDSAEIKRMSDGKVFKLERISNLVKFLKDEN